MSSFNSIMSNGVSGMTAQSFALSTISGNIANSQTVGYKRVETQYSDVDIKDRDGRFFNGSGVRASDRLRIDQSQGLDNTGVTTNAAIVGNGFFMVQDIANQTGWNDKTTSADLTGKNNMPELTRAGDFQPDQYGHFVNSAGNALLGIKLTPGNVASTSPTAAAPTVQSLDLVNTGGIKDYVEATSVISVSGNLASVNVPDVAKPEDGIAQVVSAVDSKGQRVNVGLKFTRTSVAADGASTWDVSTTGSTYTDGTTVPGSVAASLGSVSFDGFGAMTGGATGTENTLTLNAGSGVSGITLDLGAYGKFNGLTSVKDLETTGMGYQQNGIETGTLKSVQMTEDGYITGTFGEGQTRYFYRIPNANVRNPTDLQALSGTTFQQTTRSGDVKLGYFGGNDSDPKTNGATLAVASVERSGTDIASEFTNLIVAQRSYSAASKIVSTSDEMTTTTLNVKA